MYQVELTETQVQFLQDVLKNTQVVGQVGSVNLLSVIEALSKAITSKQSKK